jgi:UDP-glucose 4-epimerase
MGIIRIMEYSAEKLRGKNVLITGGAGFLGSNLARRLVENGVNTTIIALPGENLKNLEGMEVNARVEVFDGVINADANLDDMVQGKDALFHFAWQTELGKSMTNPAQDVYNDIGGLIKIMEACRKYNKDIKIVFPSTATVIGTPESLPVDESHRENPPSPYDLNKLMAEKYLGVYSKEHGLRYTCLRLSNVFGEHQRIDNPKRGILNFFIGRALRGEEITIFGDGELVRDYSYVQNFVDAFIKAAETDKTDGQMYVVGSGQGKSFNQVTEAIQKYSREVYGKDAKVTHVPIPEGTYSINMRNFVANPAKFTRDTGWTPRVGFEEGLKNTMEFYKNG